MRTPDYIVVIEVPVFASDAEDAKSRVAPYIRDMRVEANIAGVRPFAAAEIAR